MKCEKYNCPYHDCLSPDCRYLNIKKNGGEFGKKHCNKIHLKKQTFMKEITTIEQFAVEIFNDPKQMFLNYIELKEKLQEYKSAKEDLQEELNELHDKYNKLERNTKINFQFLIHKTDWQYFRNEDYWLNGTKINYSYHRDKINVKIITQQLTALPETFKHCRIKFDDTDELISFFDEIQKKKIELFSPEQFKYS